MIGDNKYRKSITTKGISELTGKFVDEARELTGQTDACPRYELN
jgi:hypothetical protein